MTITSAVWSFHLAVFPVCGYSHRKFYQFQERRGNQETDRLDALHQNVSGMTTHVRESGNALDTFLTNIQAKRKYGNLPDQNSGQM